MTQAKAKPIHKKPMNKNTPNKKKIRTVLCIIFFVLIIVEVLVSLNAIASDNSKAEETQAYTLEKNGITKAVSVSGVIKSADAQNIYSTLTVPVKTIKVSEGDRVEAGELLAELDTSALEIEKEQAELNMQNAEITAGEEARVNGNSVTNAKSAAEGAWISLERQQDSVQNAETDLQNAQKDKEKPFDSYTYDKAITDALVAAERKKKDLATAEADWDEALHRFDDYAFQFAITQAQSTLDRCKKELADAEEELRKEQSGSTELFDDYAFQSAISQAGTNYQRVSDEYKKAEQNLYNAYDAYRALSENPAANPSAVEAARAQVTTAENAKNAAARLMDDARTVWDQSRSDLSKAQSNYDKTVSDTRESVLSTREKAVQQARNLCDDAQRALDKAVTDLDRAKRDAGTLAGDAVTLARNAYEDAQRTYDKVVSDKEHAAEDYEESNRKKLEAAQKVYDDSQKLLETAENNVKTSENSLRQAQSKPGTLNTNVAMLDLTVKRLTDQLAKGLITAPISGIVTEVNATVGAAPAGILFVVEDTGKLYVSANVKEYNMNEIHTGQKVSVRSDATGDAVFDASISYVSPKAVSVAGSTNVEFEIHAELFSTDAALKIGMNAFLDIITDTKDEAYSVPLSAVITDSRGSFVYALDKGAGREIPVTVGIKTATLVEISGPDLTDGLQIVTDPAMSFKKEDK